MVGLGAARFTREFSRLPRTSPVLNACWQRCLGFKSSIGCCRVQIINRLLQNVVVDKARDSAARTKIGAIFYEEMSYFYDV